MRCSYVNSPAPGPGESTCSRPASIASRRVSASAERPPDGARQVALQAAQRLALALALGAFAGHEGPRRLVHAHLRDGDAVQGGVQLAVAAAVQAVALGLPARDRQRGDAGVHGEARLAREALRARGLADEAGGGERAAAGQGEQLGGEVGREPASISRSRASISRVSVRQRPVSSRAMRAWTPARPASSSSRRSSQQALRSASAGTSSASSRSCRCQRRRCWMRVRSATRSSRWSAEQAQLALGAGRGAPRAGPARAARRGRPRRRRSGRSCRACARSVRVCAMSFGGTRTQASPRSMRKRSRRPGDVTAVLEGEAALGGEARAQASRRSWPAPVGRHRELADELAGRASTATAVWLFLCGSIPSTIISCPLSDVTPELRDRRWTGLSGGLWPGSYQVTPANLAAGGGGHNA